MNIRGIISIAIVFLSLAPLSAKVKLPALLTNNMVLQQKTNVNLWGTAEKGKTITVNTTWNDKSYTVTAADNGEWLVSVKTPVAGGPYEIIISDGDAVKLKNILIGEVWLCSGQSNMYMPIRGYSGQPIEGSLDVVMQAKPNNNIRLFTVERSGSLVPETDCKGKWDESTPKSVSRFSATAYYFAQYLQQNLNVPIGLINSSFGGSKIQSWIDKETFQRQYPDISLDVLNKKESEIKSPRSEPTMLYNAMINPIKNYTIKGALWYQGESNRKEAGLYADLLSSMVELWRKDWKQGNFPFYQVEIAPHNYEDPLGFEAAELRLAQQEGAKRIPECGIVATGDLGNGPCIHPPKKREVGQRLAILALNKTYKQREIPHGGPVYKSSKVEKGKIIVEFNNVENGLSCSDETVEGFEIAGSDKVFYPATAELIEKTFKISLSSDKVSKPMYARYAYRNYFPVTLFNDYALPMMSFSTDK